METIRELFFMQVCSFFNKLTGNIHLFVSIFLVITHCIQLIIRPPENIRKSPVKKRSIEMG